MKKKSMKEFLDILHTTKISYFENYDVGKLLYNSISEVEQLPFFAMIKKSLHRILFDPFSVRISKSDSPVIVLNFPYGRPDHQISWNLFTSLLNETTTIDLEQNPAKIVNIPILLALESFVVWINIIIQFLRVGITKGAMLLAADLLGIYRMKKKVSKENICAKCFVSFFDGNIYENFFAQYMKSCAIKTITFQHGQPIFHGFDVDYLNQTMILNFSSDYIVVPGKFSEKQFLAGGVSPESIKVLGSLRDVRNKASFHNNYIFCLLLDAPTLDFASEVNLKMIDICECYAQKNNYKYLIKPHPNDSIEKYANIGLKQGVLMDNKSYVRDVINESDFCIMHFTGSYLDCLADRKKVFLFNTKDLFMMSDLDSELFSSISELTCRINMWETKENDEKEKYLKNIIDYYLDPDDAKERHVKFIKECCASL